MNIEELKKKNRQLEKAFLFDKMPLPEEEIIKYLDELHCLIHETSNVEDFDIMIRLFRKWSTNLLHLYSEVYPKDIEKPSSDFAEEVPRIVTAIHKRVLSVSAG